MEQMKGVEENMHHSEGHRRRWHPKPAQTISASFALMILVGALLLNLPIASRDGQSVGFLNALFTATSANCVTGLVVVDTASHWTAFGKVVILLLIQFGGLGLVSILTVSMVLLRRRVKLESRLAVQATFNQENLGGMVRLVRRVVQVTLLCEGLGAVLLTAGFALGSPRIPLGRAVVLGIFQSISSFCNAGFDIIGPASLLPYQSNWFILLVVMGLIVGGGLGFTVWGELLETPRLKKNRRLSKRWAHLSLHSKIVLLITGVLLVGAMMLFLLFEWGNPGTLGPMSGGTKLLSAMFQSVTLRTCGYASIDQGKLTEASQLLSSLLMIVGGSPASTAGGIKTVTLGVIAIAMVSGLRGRETLSAMERRLPLDLLQKALTVTGALLFIVLTTTFILSFTERQIAMPHTLLDLFFEASSAAGTVGVSTGITPHLSTGGKVALTLCMYMGRLGPVTVAMALQVRQRRNTDTVSYPQERVIIG